MRVMLSGAMFPRPASSMGSDEAERSARSDDELERQN
jgi:hypothetical protein